MILQHHKQSTNKKSHKNSNKTKKRSETPFGNRQSHVTMGPKGRSTVVVLLVGLAVLALLAAGDEGGGSAARPSRSRHRRSALDDLATAMVDLHSHVDLRNHAHHHHTPPTRHHTHNHHHHDGDGDGGDGDSDKEAQSAKETGGKSQDKGNTPTLASRDLRSLLLTYGNSSATGKLCVDICIYVSAFSLVSLAAFGGFDLVRTLTHTHT